jgi:hypothetical protein
LTNGYFDRARTTAGVLTTPTANLKPPGVELCVLNARRSRVGRAFYARLRRHVPASSEVPIMRLLVSSLSIATPLAVVSVLSCTSTTGGGENPSDGGSAEASSGGGCMPYDGGSPGTLMTPTRSFLNDVVPVFTFSCDFSGCHISPSGTPLEYLGDEGTGSMPPSTYTFANAVYMGIVGKPTIEDPQMMFVKPGDPTNSYLMRKMDGALCDLTCAPNNALYNQFVTQDNLSTPCGSFMPITSQTILDQSKRDIVRQWIAQGAKNN